VNETATFALTLTAVGILIVFLVQALISIIVALIRGLDERWREREREQAERALVRDPTIDRTTLVLICAAVSTVLQGRHRIRAVRRLLPADSQKSPWSVQGRAVLQGSHVLTRSRRD